MRHKKFHAFVVFGILWGLGTLIIAGTLLVKIIGLATLIAGGYLSRVIKRLDKAQRDLDPEG